MLVATLVFAQHVVKRIRKYFMRPPGQVGLYCALLYNLYSGARVTDVPYTTIIYLTHIHIPFMWGLLRLTPVILEVLKA